MIKSCIIIIAFLLSGLWLPLTPSSTVIYFAKGTTLTQAITAIQSYHGERGWFYAEHQTSNNRTITRAFRFIGDDIAAQTYQPQQFPEVPLAVRRVELYDLDPTTLQSLRRSTQISEIQEPPLQAVTNLLFFSNF